MKKKIIIVTLTVISVLSIGFNLLLINSLPDFLSTDNERAKKDFGMLRFFQTSRVSDSIPVNNNANVSGEVISVFDSTLHKLSTMEDELITVSGGVKAENYELINAHGVYYVSEYFYYKNNWRPKAYRFFKKTVNDYIKTIDTININNSLKESFLNCDKHNDSPMFTKFTVLETILFLDMISRQVKEDKLKYILKKRSSELRTL